MSIAVPDPTSFLAIDFETATSRRDSACAIGLAVGCAGRVVLSRTYLIRPPTTRFTFSDLHGLTWKDVRDAPSFAEFWPTLRAWIDAQHCSPPTTRHSTGASCTPVAPGTGYDRHGRRSPAPCSSLARGGESTRQHCQTSAAACIFRSAITTPNQTQRHAHASCSQPRLNAHRIARPPRSIE